MTYEQIALVINNYFKFDTAAGEAGDSEGVVLFLHVYLLVSSRKSIIPDSCYTLGTKKFLWGHFFVQTTEQDYSDVWHTKV